MPSDYNYWQKKKMYEQMHGAGPKNQPQAAKPPAEPPKIIVSVPQDKDEHIKVLERLLYEAWGVICDQTITGETRSRAFGSLDRKMRELGILPSSHATVRKKKSK